MKIDAHVHSIGISKCSRVTYEQIVKNKQAVGYDGAVLMNHCQPWYYKSEELKDWIENFIQEFNRAYEYGKNLGFTYFLGIEVSVSVPMWTDFLIFGVTEEFLRNAPDMCRISQQELYEYCQKYGALMVQAHPKRMNFEFLDPAYMDGVEINISPRDINNRAIVEEFAKEHGIGVTVGSDYHEAYDGDFGGLIIPDDIENSVDLVNYMKNQKELTAFIADEVFKCRGFYKK